MPIYRFQEQSWLLCALWEKAIDAANIVIELNSSTSGGTKEESEMSASFLLHSEIHTCLIAWSLKSFYLEHRYYPTTAQLNSPEHIQVPGNRWDASKGVEQAAWCNFEVILYHLWKVMTAGGRYWWLEKGRQSHSSSRKARRKIQGTRDQSTLSQFLGRLWSKSSQKPFLNPWKRWLGTASMGLARADQLCCFLSQGAWHYE